MYRRHECGELFQPRGEDDLAYLLLDEGFGFLEHGAGGFLFGFLRQFLLRRRGE